MEEGQCDSDVSDGWSVVDYKSPEDKSTFQVIGNSGEVDECFELTEMTALESVKIPDKQDLQKTVLVDHHESEGDTDGISVISDDEEYINWKQEAHDHYRNTMQLLDSSSDSPFLRKMSTVDNDRPVDISFVDNLEEDAGNESENDALTGSSSSMGASTASTAIPTDQPIPSQPVEEAQFDVSPDTWHQAYFNFLNKYFFASAVFAAITCIALAQFLKTHGAKDKVAEMLEVLERLRVENEVLKAQLNDVTTAYSALEARLNTNQNSHKALPCQKGISSKMFQDREALLSCLQEMAESNEINASTVIKEIYSKLNETPQDKLESIEVKVANTLENLLRGLESIDRISLRLSELNKRLRRHNKRGQRQEGVKIVQWFPEDDTAKSDPTPEPETTDSQGDSDLNARLGGVDSTLPSAKNDENSADLKDASIELNHDVNNADVQSLSSVEMERLKSADLKNDDGSKQNEWSHKAWKKKKRWEGKTAGDYETVPQFGKARWKQERPPKPKVRPNGQKLPKVIGRDWQGERAKGRGALRDNYVGDREECSSNGTGDWYMARGKAREFLRDVDVKAMWYLRRIWRSLPPFRAA